MDILIIEDENHAAKRLTKLIHQKISNANILKVIDSVSEAISFLKMNTPDIIFMDIQLADGMSFDIFKKVEVTSKVIFTTAFDEYALQAFKVNGLGYLLKPIDENEFDAAIEKCTELISTVDIDYSKIAAIISENSSNYKERFLIKNGNHFVHVQTKNIACFYSEEGHSYCLTQKKEKYIFDESLEQIFNQLNPKSFFRINRKIIINIDFLDRSHMYFNARLKLDMIPKPDFEVIVSREKVNEFKSWLGN